jgi:hypothetical protein
MISGLPMAMQAKTTRRVAVIHGLILQRPAPGHIWSGTADPNLPAQRPQD